MKIFIKYLIGFLFFLGAVFSPISASAATLSISEVEYSEHTYAENPGSVNITFTGWDSFAFSSSSDKATFLGVYASANPATKTLWAFLVEPDSPSEVSDWVKIVFTIDEDGNQVVAGQFQSLSAGYSGANPNIPVALASWSNPAGPNYGELTLAGIYGTVEQTFLQSLNFFNKTGVASSLPSGLTFTAVSSVPIPGALWLFVSSLLGMTAIKRTKRLI